MKLTKYKPFDPAWHFANQIGDMFYNFREEFSGRLELTDRKKAKEYGLGKYKIVFIRATWATGKDVFKYDISLLDRNYQEVQMMKIPAEAWIGLYNYFVELYTRWENNGYSLAR